MQIVGVIDKILDKSNPPFRKRVAVLRDSIDQRNKWCVEFRGQLSESAVVLRSGDYIKVDCYNDGQIDSHGNCYNNL